MCNCHSGILSATPTKLVNTLSTSRCSYGLFQACTTSNRLQDIMQLLSPASAANGRWEGLTACVPHRRPAAVKPWQLHAPDPVPRPSSPPPRPPKSLISPASGRWQAARARRPTRSAAGQQL